MEGNIMRLCANCGGELHRRHKEWIRTWENRKYCSNYCQLAGRRVPPATPVYKSKATEGRLEDLEWLIESGESPQRIPERLGTTPEALARWLFRYGHNEYGRLFKRTDVRKAA